MKKEIISISIVSLLVIAGFVGVLNLFGGKVVGTNVSGTIYDGAGGPWTAAGNPYIVVGNIFVPAGETLTIEPGVEVRFDGFYSFKIEGSLIAVGIASDMIIVTSNTGMSGAGDWDKIVIEPSGYANVQYCEISFGCLGIFLKSSNNLVSNSNFVMNNDYGLCMENSSGNQLSGNSFYNSGIGMYGYQIDTWNTHHIDTSNTVNGKPIYYIKDQVGGTIPLGAGQVILANCSDMQIINQELTFASIGIELGFSLNINIAGNNISYNNRINPGINGSGNPNATDGSTVNFCGIYLYKSHGNTIDNNHITDNEEGILLEHSNWNTIKDNDLYFNLEVVPIFYSSNITFIENDVNGTFGWGTSVHPFRSSYVLISKNRISNGGHCIHIQSSDNITVTQNNLSSCNGEGVRLSGADNVAITHNDIISNGLGIRMFVHSNRILIHHNNIIANDIQGIDWESNQWDDGYPSGGNYWSDFDEASEGAYDDYGGPNQDILGSDGIVDMGMAAGGGKNPYVIDPDSQDNYPHIEPFDNDAFPGAPMNIITQLSPGSLNDVELIWNASPDDGAGYNDVAGYTVYKSTTGVNGSFGFAAWIPANGSSSYIWTDMGVGDGDWNDYYYIVRANDTLGNEEQNNYKVGKSVNHLVDGWNLISVPLVQLNTTMEYVFQTIMGNINAVQGYHAGKSRPWMNWHKDKPDYMNDEIEIDHEDGYYISMMAPDYLVVCGKVPAGTSIPLKAGWNLVGYPSSAPRTVADALSSIAGMYNKVEFFNTVTDREEDMASDDYMQPQLGYWIHCTSDCLWEIPY